MNFLVTFMFVQKLNMKVYIIQNVFNHKFTPTAESMHSKSLVHNINVDNFKYPVKDLVSFNRLRVVTVVTIKYTS